MSEPVLAHKQPSLAWHPDGAVLGVARCMRVLWPLEVTPRQRQTDTLVRQPMSRARVWLSGVQGRPCLPWHGEIATGLWV